MPKVKGQVRHFSRFPGLLSLLRWVRCKCKRAKSGYKVHAKWPRVGTKYMQNGAHQSSVISAAKFFHMTNSLLRTLALDEHDQIIPSGGHRPIRSYNVDNVTVSQRECNK